MFDNVLGQDEVVARLSAEVAQDRLPPALLFQGPPASGKLSAALELGRALSCAGPERGAWACPCPSCARHRVLAHPDLLLFGSRGFPEELPAALELLGRAPGKAAAFFFVRAARKLARRFDAALYEGEESRLAKAAPLLREVEEALDGVAPERATAAALASGAEAAAGRAAEACAKLEALAPDSPPVFMVRNAEIWARLAPLGNRKLVVIENADRMLEGSRNALLKILEEPPASVRFVLTTSRRGAVMATILSRVRDCSFRPRDGAGTAAVIERVFRSSEPAASVEAFLAARRAFPPDRARTLARRFLGAALARRRPPLDPALEALAAEARAVGDSTTEALAALLDQTKDFGQKDERYADSFRAFLEAFAGELGSLLSEPGLGAAGLAFAERAGALARAAAADRETLNRSPSLLAETLLYSLGEQA